MDDAGQSLDDTTGVLIGQQTADGVGQPGAGPFPQMRGQRGGAMRIVGNIQDPLDRTRNDLEAAG